MGATCCISATALWCLCLDAVPLWKYVWSIYSRLLEMLSTMFLSSFKMYQKGNAILHWLKIQNHLNAHFGYITLYFSLMYRFVCCNRHTVNYESTSYLFWCLGQTSTLQHQVDLLSCWEKQNSIFFFFKLWKPRVSHWLAFQWISKFLELV